MPPVTRVVTSDRMNARDITGEFTEAAAKLEVGQLVKDEHFTLFEAVGALEIMDSRMDSGYLAPGETLDDDYDVTRKLLPEEVLGIMDQLLCHEAAWHMGHPLSQTLFTSIYLDRLLWPVARSLEKARFVRDSHNKAASQRADDGNGLVSVVLRAYCVALVKACDLVHARVSAEYYFEEEDFVTLLYDRNLLSNIEPEKVQNVLDTAIVWLEQNSQQMDGTIKQAFLDRLLFRRKFLSFLSTDTAVMEPKSTEYLQSTLGRIDLIHSSIALGKPVEEAFSHKIQRRLASTVPPRPIIKINPDDAIAYLKRICQDAMDLQGFLKYRTSFDLEKSIATLQTRKPQPSAYIRALVQSLLVQDSLILGSIDAGQFCCDDIVQLVLPRSPLIDPQNDTVEFPSDPRYQISKHMKEFVQRMSQPFVDFYRTMCLNRCRMRRTLCHAIVDWDRLQAEAEEYDVHLRTLTMEPPIHIQGEPTYSYPLSSWTYHQKLHQMRLIIQLGFELSIYSPEELPGMYWYLSHISSAHLSHLDRIRACVSVDNERVPVRQGNKSSAVKAMERKEAYDQSFALHDRLITELVAIDAFSIALHALYILLWRHNLIKPNYRPSTTKEYSPQKFRYELRMKPFLPIPLPEVVPFDVFERESTLQGDSDKMVLNRAVRAVAEAKKGFEQCIASGPFLRSNVGAAGIKQDESQLPGLAKDVVKDMKDTLRSCIAASIAIGVVKKAILDSPTPATGTSPLKLNLSVEIPEPGSTARWHDWWVVPKVSEVIAVRGGSTP